MELAGENEGYDAEDGEPEGHLGDAGDREAVGRGSSSRHGDVLVGGLLGRRQRWYSELLLSTTPWGGGDSPSSYAPTDDAAIDAQGPLQHGAKSAGLKGSCLCRGRDPHLTGAVIGLLQAMPRF